MKQCPHRSKCPLSHSCEQGQIIVCPSDPAIQTILNKITSVKKSKDIYYTLKYLIFLKYFKKYVFHSNESIRQFALFTILKSVPNFISPEDYKSLLECPQFQLQYFITRLEDVLYYKDEVKYADMVSKFILHTISPLLKKIHIMDNSKNIKIYKYKTDTARFTKRFNVYGHIIIEVDKDDIFMALQSHTISHALNLKASGRFDEFNGYVTLCKKEDVDIINSHSINMI